MLRIFFRKLIHKPGELVAIVVSICALGATFFQSYQTMRHDKLSVLPIADLYFTKLRIEPESGGIRFETAGLGPAFLKPIQLFLDGKQVSDVPTYAEFFGANKLPDAFPYAREKIMYIVVPMHRSQIADASTAWAVMTI